MVKIHFYGAAGIVTGSNFLIDTGEHRYVVDCGIFQGGDHLARHNSEPFAYDPAAVEAVVITHAHLDHIGRLPKLVKDGFRGPIYATEATIELAGLTLTDALELMEHEEKEHQHPALYNKVDLQRTLGLFKPIKYHTPQELFGSDSVTLYNAGHILGSASALVEAGGKKLIFTGDLGHAPNILLPHSETPVEAHAVITEGTYGGVEHEEGPNRLDVIRQAVEWTIQNHGVLLIPAFSIERSQELLYLFHELYAQHKLPKVPIYFDSPLGIEALEVFERHQELFNKDVQQEHTQDPFSFRNLVITPTVENSRTINEQRPPKIIIAGSGMMSGGRIVHHLKRYLSERNTLLMVVGYQAEGTLGREIVDGAKWVNVAGAHVSVHCKVQVSDIFSGHADDGELVAWLKAVHYLGNQPHIIIVHSDPERAETFRGELAKEFSNVQVSIAKLNESVEV